MPQTGETPACGWMGDNMYKKFFYCHNGYYTMYYALWKKGILSYLDVTHDLNSFYMDNGHILEYRM